MKKEPTIKQKKAFERVVENRGNVSKSMREAGYTDATAKNPKNLTESLAWKDMLEEYLPDDMLLKVQIEGLGATTIKTSQTEPDKEVKDYAVRHKYLETGLKIKGHLKDKVDLVVKGEPSAIVLNVSESVVESGGDKKMSGLSD